MSGKPSARKEDVGVVQFYSEFSEILYSEPSKLKEGHFMRF